MSDTVLIVAIVVPAMLMATLGVVGLIMGRCFRVSANADSEGIRFKAASRKTKNR